jgi:sugar/nucleoside kinase (ribokinase family)
MAPRDIDILAIGAPAVDIQVFSRDEILQRFGIPKGIGAKFEPAALAQVIAAHENPVRTAGSSGVNIATGIAMRGGTAAFIGTIAHDAHGIFFADRLKLHGVAYTPLLSPRTDAGTTTVAVLTTPDGERSFAVSGDASDDITPDCIDAAQVARAKMVSLDSYLWDTANGAEAALHALALGRSTGTPVALVLNGQDLIAARADALRLAQPDILIGDRAECAAFLGTQSHAETLAALLRSGITAAITAGSDGAHIVTSGRALHIPAVPVRDVVDTSGAGDQFAAGFLWGRTRGLDLEDSARCGTQWAADIIRHAGAEPRGIANDTAFMAQNVYKRSL